MDPLSQGVIGAVAAQQTSNRKHLIIATLLGFFTGMSADLDIFFRSSNDPLFYLEYHRQFTHSLLFIPIGSLICTIFFYFVFLTPVPFEQFAFLPLNRRCLMVND